jgi:hypothetical protein
MEVQNNNDTEDNTYRVGEKTGFKHSEQAVTSNGRTATTMTEAGTGNGFRRPGCEKSACTSPAARRYIYYSS